MEKSGNIIIIEAGECFKKIHKSIIENKDIGCEALGVYTRIITLGVKWKLNIKGLSKHLCLSDAKIRKAIQCLEKEGYIVRKAVSGEKGKLCGWNYNVYPYPVPENERSSAGKPSLQKTDTRYNRQHGFPTTRFTDMSENGQDNNIRLKEYKDLNKLKDNNNNGDDGKFVGEVENYDAKAYTSPSDYNIENQQDRQRLVSDLLSLNLWAETLQRSFGLNTFQLPQAINECIDEMILGGEKTKSLQDAKNHIRNLLRKKQQFKKTTGGGASDPGQSWDERFVNNMVHGLATASERDRQLHRDAEDIFGKKV